MHLMTKYKHTEVIKAKFNFPTHLIAELFLETSVFHTHHAH